MWYTKNIKEIEKELKTNLKTGLKFGNCKLFRKKWRLF